ADPRSRNDIAREWRAGIGIQRHGPALTEIPGAFEGRRHDGSFRVGSGHITPFQSEKCEELVLLGIPHFRNEDRTCQRETIVVIAGTRLIVEHETARGELIAEKEFVRAEVIFLRGASSDEIDLCAGIASEFGSVAAGIDLHLFDEIYAEDIVY